MLKSLLLFLIVTIMSVVYSTAGVTDDLAPCVVFLVQEVATGQEAHIGSGFLVRTEETVFLVTASHVSQQLGNKWKIVMQGKDGKAILGQINNIKWQESRDADVAVLQINQILNDPNQIKSFLNRSIPITHLSARPLPPDREIPLTVMGYPLGLGVLGYVSPLSLETKAASGFITLPRFDNKQLATFILLQDPSLGGLSGAPVFDTGKSYFEGGRKISVREGISVVGLIHGVISDKSGGFAAVVPATEIVKLLSPETKPGQ